MSTYEVVYPLGRRAPRSKALAARPRSLDGLTLGLLWNSKRGGEFALSAQVLQEFVVNAVGKKELGLTEENVARTLESLRAVRVLPITQEGKMGVDLHKAFVAVGFVGEQPIALAVNKDVPVKNVAELVALVRPLREELGREETVPLLLHRPLALDEARHEDVRVLQALRLVDEGQLGLLLLRGRLELLALDGVYARLYREQFAAELEARAG